MQKDLQEAERLFAQMKADGLKPNEPTYTTMLMGYRQLGQDPETTPQTALQLFEELRESERLNEIVFTALIGVLGKFRRYNEMNHYFMVMRRRYLVYF